MMVKVLELEVCFVLRFLVRKLLRYYQFFWVQFIWIFASTLIGVSASGRCDWPSRLVEMCVNWFGYVNYKEKTNNLMHLLGKKSFMQAILCAQPTDLDPIFWFRPNFLITQGVWSNIRVHISSNSCGTN